VASSWDRITAWLQAHAPTTAAAVNPPAADEAIADAAWTVGVPLPADVRALYRAADGMRDGPDAGCLIPPVYGLCPLEEALCFQRARVDAFAERHSSDEHWGTAEEVDSAPAGTLGVRWSQHWLPLATSGLGIVLFADLRYGRLRGCVMKYDKIEGADTPPIWPTVSAMLADIAHAHDGTAAGHRPYVDEEARLDWR
jgi:cell wall assembly regulator SMI1